MFGAIIIWMCSEFDSANLPEPSQFREEAICTHPMCALNLFDRLVRHWLHQRIFIIVSKLQRWQGIEEGHGEHRRSCFQQLFDVAKRLVELFGMSPILSRVEKLRLQGG